MIWDLAKIILLAILSALLSGIWVSRWKASLDHAEKRIDDLCAEITKLADLASEYWITAQTDDKIPVLQARITSGLMRIATMRVTLSKFVIGLAEEPQPGKNLGLIMCILVCCGFVPLLGLFTGIAALVCWILYWVKIAGCSAKLA